MSARAGILYWGKGPTTTFRQSLPVAASSEPHITKALPIVQTPDILGGAPRIAGRRIGVQHIAVWHERLGMSVADIVREFDLSSDEVQAAIDYYYRNRDEIDALIRADDTLIQDIEKQTAPRTRP